MQQERVDEESEQSMDASDAPSVTQPGMQSEPVASSTYPNDDAPVHYFDCGSEEQYPEEDGWFTKILWAIITFILSIFNKKIKY